MGSPEDRNSTSMNILYVEDNFLDAWLTKREFGRQSPQSTLEHVSTLKDAIERLSRATPDEPVYDIVLADLYLPDGNGTSLISILEDRRLPIALVIVTGAGNEGIAIAALKEGATDYIAKHDDYLLRLPGILEKAILRYRQEMSFRARTLNILYAEPHPADVALTLRHFKANAPFIRLETVGAAHDVLNIFAHPAETANEDAQPYDLLLLDYHLPGMNAIEIMKEILVYRQMDIPVVILTGQGDEDSALQALRLGAMDYVIKRDDYLYRLPWILENAIDRSRARREHRLLREREQHMRALLENASDVIIEVDSSLAVKYASPSLGHITGTESSNLKGMGFLEFVHEDDREHAESTIEWAVKNPGIVSALTETRFLCKDGSCRCIEWLCKGFHGTSGGMTLVVNGRDVTAKKEAENELRLDEYRLESLLKIIQHRTDDVQDFLDVALNEAVTLTDSRIGFVGYYDETRKEFALSTWSKDTMKECGVKDKPVLYRLDETGIWGEAVRQAKPIVLNDFLSFHPLKKGYPEGHIPISRFLIIPVFVKERIVAVVAVANKPDDYDQSDVGSSPC